MQSVETTTIRTPCWKGNIMSFRSLTHVAILMASAGMAQAQGSDLDAVKVLTSVQFDLPVSDEMLPDAGVGTDEINYTCLACHSADQVFYQPYVAREQWAETVERMETAYKAVIDPADKEKILDYLTAFRGLK